MNIKDELNINDVTVQSFNDNSFQDLKLTINILRLDKIHPIVSGNKWFKLKYYLQHAISNNYKTIATFGGAYSNHILATAYACNSQNIDCIGFIRGEEPKQYSKTLLDAKALNMQLVFLNRGNYKNNQSIIQNNPSYFFIPEGGYGQTGVKGAAEIMQLVPNPSSYNYIVCAAGTGTMLAGIANAYIPHQQCIGISVFKNNFSLKDETLSLINDAAKHRIHILHDYHFGGYAKYTQELTDFMNAMWKAHQVPLDFVYTAKAFYALFDLARKKYFTSNTKILFIHSGGLQGNRSLEKDTLLYE